MRAVIVWEIGASVHLTHDVDGYSKYLYKSLLGGV